MPKLKSFDNDFFTFPVGKKQIYFAINKGQTTYIKIDVDGFEDKVVEGGMNIFKKTKSILIEVDNKNINYLTMIEALGFKLESKHKRNEEEYNYILTNANRKN